MGGLDILSLKGHFPFEVDSSGERGNNSDTVPGSLKQTLLLSVSRAFQPRHIFEKTMTL